MKALKITIIIGAVLGTILVGGYTALIIYINTPSDIILAKEIDVTYEWTEIEISPAITAENQQQSIDLTTPNIDWNSKLDGIQLKDGPVLRPDLELIDETGSAQSLTLTGFTRKYGASANYGAAESTLGFAKNRKFVKVRIKSDIPFACNTIAWSDYNPK